MNVNICIYPAAERRLRCRVRRGALRLPSSSVRWLTSHLETLMIYNICSMKFTGQSDLYQ